jgi:hypothetical protein
MLKQKQSLRYEDLIKSFRKGLRNSNWKRLSRMQQGFYRAAMWYAKRTGKIVNGMMVEKLSALIERLLDSPGARVFRKGFEKAVELLQKSEENGVFVWAPRLKHWLKDPDYIFWLGTMR